jgi:hypothetical protein
MRPGGDLDAVQINGVADGARQIAGCALRQFH